MANVLDFEKPVLELEQKVEDLREYGRKHNVDVSHGLELLEKQVEESRERIFTNLTPWQRVQLARHPDRPYVRDYIDRLFTDFQELHGDRRFADDAAMVAGFATFDGESVVVIGTQKGRDLQENVKVNFGSAHPEGYRKALRVMELAEKAGAPIVCLIDTPGAFPGIGAEERHIAEAIAVNLREMFRFTVPILAVVVGEGGSGGALGIGVGDRILILENAYYSVITPEGCAAILWRDAGAAPQAASALKLTSSDLKEAGIVDEVLSEPLGGAHRDWDQTAQTLADAVRRHLGELKALDVDTLRSQRYEKYRNIGVFTEG